MILWRWLLAALLLAAAPVAWAQQFPKFTGFVVDAANVIPADKEAALTQKLDQLQQTTNHQLVVATVPSLQDYPIEDYGYRLGRAWAVGLKDADNGAILLIAPNDRKVRVEVGYGLEPVLTDAFSSTVVNGTILPRFKAGDLPGGIVAGVDALAQQLSLPDADAQARAKAAAAEYDRTRTTRRTASGGGVPFALVFWGMVLLFVLLSIGRGRGKRRHGKRYRSRSGGGSGAWPIVLWSIANEIDRNSRGGGGGGFGGWGGGSGGGGGGWGGGGFGGGGGGGFGGGGASGGW